MKYQGSKNKHVDMFLPIILRNRSGYFVDLFCGGCNVVDRVKGLRIANDNHFYLISLFKALQKGWLPPTKVSEGLYEAIRIMPEAYEPELVGFVGFCCSFGGKWFGGYARDKSRDPVAEAYNNLLAQAPQIYDVEYYCGDYRDVIYPDGSTIYCDPPYQETLDYGSKFDHKAFWEWVRLASQKHIVWVSGYQAPSDFECVWSKCVNVIMSRTTVSQNVERLFRYEPNSL